MLANIKHQPGSRNLKVLKYFIHTAFLCYFPILLYESFYLSWIESFDNCFCNISVSTIQNTKGACSKIFLLMSWNVKSPDAWLPVWTKGEVWATWYLPKTIFMLLTSHLQHPLQSLTGFSQVSNAGRFLSSCFPGNKTRQSDTASSGATESRHQCPI